MKGAFQFNSPAVSEDGIVYSATSIDIYSFQESGKADLLYSLGTGEWFSCDLALDKAGNLYIGTTGGRLLKISPSGRLLWSHQSTTVDETVRGAPSLDGNGNVYFGTTGGTLYCLSDEGYQLWSYDVEGEIWTKPAIEKNGTVFFGTMVPGSRQKNRFYALKEGTLLWSFETVVPSSGFYSSPAIGDGESVYAACHDGYLYALNSRTGVLNWKCKLTPHGIDESGAISSSPVIGSDGRIYICTQEGDFYAITQEGEILWMRALKGTIHSTPVVSSEGILYLIEGREAALLLLSESGTLVRSLKLGRDSYGSPVMTEGGTLYLTTSLNDIASWSQLICFQTQGTPSGFWPMLGLDQRHSGGLN